jgi:hypothetical protein
VRASWRKRDSVGSGRARPSSALRRPAVKGLVDVVGDGHTGGRVRPAHFPNRFPPLEHAATGSATTMRPLLGQVSARKLPGRKVGSWPPRGGGLPRRYSPGGQRLVGRSSDRGSIRITLVRFGASAAVDWCGFGRARGLRSRAGTRARRVSLVRRLRDYGELSVGGE